MIGLSLLTLYIVNEVDIKIVAIIYHYAKCDTLLEIKLEKKKSKVYDKEIMFPA